MTRLHQEDLCQAPGCLPDCTDKMIIGDIERAIGASYELRNKKDLIEAFIDSLGSSNDVTADWEKYLAEAKERELSAIIEEEALDDMATREFMANAFVDGGVPESGTEMAGLMTRKPSRFAPANAYAEMKARVLDRLKGFFDRFVQWIGKVIAHVHSRMGLELRLQRCFCSCGCSFRNCGYCCSDSLGACSLQARGGSKGTDTSYGRAEGNCRETGGVRVKNQPA